jgi:hypothetical protein
MLGQSSKTVSRLLQVANSGQIFSSSRTGNVTIYSILFAHHLIQFFLPLPVHGCLFRIYAPDSSRSFVVDQHFSKRKDAKTAVCFLAISQDVCTYIRAIGDAVNAKISVQMRKLVLEHTLPALESEYMRLRPRTHPTFIYTRDIDGVGFGQILRVGLTLLQQLA